MHGQAPCGDDAAARAATCPLRGWGRWLISPTSTKVVVGRSSEPSLTRDVAASRGSRADRGWALAFPWPRGLSGRSGLPGLTRQDEAFYPYRSVGRAEEIGEHVEAEPGDAEVVVDQHSSAGDAVRVDRADEVAKQSSRSCLLGVAAAGRRRPVACAEQESGFDRPCEVPQRGSLQARVGEPSWLSGRHRQLHPMNGCATKPGDRGGNT